jgi:hypothetical protein
MLRAIDPHQLSRHTGRCFNRVMNSAGQSRKIGIVSANDNASVIGRLIVQAYKMATIQRQDNPLFISGKLQHGFIGQRLIRPSGFLNGQHIMSQPAQFFDNRQGKVFVGVKPSHV